jgi:hypothetical protein
MLFRRYPPETILLAAKQIAGMALSRKARMGVFCKYKW